VILIHQRHRQTDGQTDGQHAISIPRYALVHRAVKTGPKKNRIQLRSIRCKKLIHEKKKKEARESET